MAAVGPVRPAAGAEPLRRHARGAAAPAAARRYAGVAALRRRSRWRRCSLDGRSPYTTVLMIDLLIAALFAASLHFIMGPAGMHSFGHAAYFGLGAYGAALLVQAQRPADGAGAGRRAAGRRARRLRLRLVRVRLSGVYLAMLTLAFAQITWAIVYQWDAFTGGSNGLTGVWPAAWLADKRAYYWLTLALLVAGCGLLRPRAVLALRLCAARAAATRRCAPTRSASTSSACSGSAFVVAGTVAGLAGALYAFSKGSISPETLGVGKSVDGLVMVLLGGVQTLLGPVGRRRAFTWLQDTVARNTDYWRAMLGGDHPAAGAAVPAGHRRLR